MDFVPEAEAVLVAERVGVCVAVSVELRDTDCVELKEGLWLALREFV